MTFQDQQDRIEYYNSPEFKESEAIRREAAKPKTHVPVDFSRCYCPVYDKIRPEWLCSQEHGDYHEIIDKEG